MIYCDTSLLIAALTIEQRSVRAQDWLASQDVSSLCISQWVISEFSSAMSIKLRRGDFPADERARVLGNFRHLQGESLIVLPVPHEAFELAARLCDNHQSGLRAGDALHLATASIGGHSLATMDKVLRKAAALASVGVTGP